MKTETTRLLTALYTLYNGYLGETQRIALQRRLNTSKCKLTVIIDELGTVYHAVRKMKKGQFVEKSHPSWAFLHSIKEQFIKDFETVNKKEYFLKNNDLIQKFKII